MSELVKLDHETYLSELIFLHRYDIIIGQDESTECLDRTIYTNYATRSIRWGFRFSKDYTLTVEAVDSYAKVPQGNFFLNLTKDTKGGETELIAGLRFSMGRTDLADTEFGAAIANILKRRNDVVRAFSATLEIRIKAEDYFNIQPWMFARVLLAPTIPSFLEDSDYRSQMFNSATAKPDFTIKTPDGNVESVRYLLYLTIDRIHVEVDKNPNIHFIAINFHKAIVEEMVNYALKGSFGLFDSSAETLDEFLACIRLYRPHRYWGLIHRITEHLRDKLVKEWRSLTMEEILNYLKLGCNQRLYEVSTKAAIIIANVHYKTFTRDYNAESNGERLLMYSALKEAEFPFEGNAIVKIESVYYSGRGTSRILRCKTQDTSEGLCAFPTGCFHERLSPL